MNAEITLYKTNGTTIVTDRIIAFSLRKERYTPYTELRVTLDASNLSYHEWKRIELNFGDRTMHNGIIDTIFYEIVCGGKQCTITSRGFTSLLLENQMPEGLYTGISINTLVDDYFTLPFVEREDSPDDSSYIFVKKGASMWDSVVNLAYKLNGKYPYIRGANKITINEPSDCRQFQYGMADVVSYGQRFDTRHMASDFHMADIGGDYGTFDRRNNDAISRYIVRNRYFELDKRFLHSPPLGCEFRDDMAQKAMKQVFFVSNNYKGEDIGDKILWNGTYEKIGSVKVTYNSKGLHSETVIYMDSF